MKTLKAMFGYLRPSFRAMGGKAPEFIVTDEDANMRAAIITAFPDSIHKLCM
jgi:hypothetical protein